MTRFRVLNLESENGESKVTETTVNTAPSWTMKDLMDDLEHKVKGSVSAMFCSGRRVNHSMLTDISTTKTLTWTSTEPGFRVVEANSLRALYERGEGYRLNAVLKSLKEVNSFCTKGPRAMRASSGSGGVYFLKPNSGNHIVACFKPRDDEPGSRNNPNQGSQRDGIIPGEAAEREVAAFILDWGGFCGVPATLLAEAACDMFPDSLRSPKIGSFQTFIQHAEETVGDFSPHLFSAPQVHKIGILDLRFLNMDRNDSNILVVQKNSEYHLCPIDHGLCFPAKIEVGWCDWVWWDWPQTLMPFDQETREWVLSLDVNEDLRILEQCFGFRPDCLRVYRCMTSLLQKGVAAGFTLRDIASVVVRSQDIDEPSAMEKTVIRATELASLMVSNSRSKPHCNGMIRSASFDGNLSTATANSVPDSLFFPYFDRLLDDIIAEVMQKKVFSLNLPDFDGGWFSASSRSSPSELTKIASPRMPAHGRGKSAFSMDMTNNEAFRNFPMLNLHQ
jgi:hypothetical protein